MTKFKLELVKKNNPKDKQTTTVNNAANLEAAVKHCTQAYPNHKVVVPEKTKAEWEAFQKEQKALEAENKPAPAPAK